MADKNVDLTAPIKGHGNRMFSMVRIREPTARDFLELGSPQAPIYGPNGTFTMADNDQTIAAYLQRCIREPVADIVLSQVSLADVMRIREALLDFFTDARKIARGSGEPSPETSADAPTP
jgi:hypothetical protein